VGTSFNALKIKLLTPLNALAVLAFSLPARAGFRLPVTGVNETNVPSLEVQSLVSRIIGIPFQTFTKVGSLSPSSLLITYSPRVTLQQALKVTNISLSFSINCLMKISDTINVVIPNIYGITGPVGVTSNNGMNMYIYIYTYIFIKRHFTICVMYENLYIYTYIHIHIYIHIYP
jgi:hypothetical protein